MEYAIAYWRTASGFEVDFILGDRNVALEIKGIPEVRAHHLRSMRAFQDEYKPKKAIVVSLDAKLRNVDGIMIMPWKTFLGDLWTGAIIA